MLPPFTDAQEALLSALRMSNTDYRALQIIEAAFTVRNANAKRSITTPTEALRDLERVVDEVAG